MSAYCAYLHKNLVKEYLFPSQLKNVLPCFLTLDKLLPKQFQEL